MRYLLNIDLTNWDNPVILNSVFESDDDIRLFLIDTGILEDLDINELLSIGYLVFDKRCAFYVGDVAKIN